MRIPLTVLRRVGLCWLAGELATELPAQLAASSPFVPPLVMSLPSAAAAALEVRGILVFGAQAMFCIRDAGKKQNVWVRLNEPGHDFTVKRYEPATDMLTIEQRGRIFTLSLRNAKTATASDREIVFALIATAPVSLDGTDLDPPRWIRDALKNDSLSEEDLKRYLDERLHRKK